MDPIIVERGNTARIRDLKIPVGTGMAAQHGKPDGKLGIGCSRFAQLHVQKTSIKRATMGRNRWPRLKGLAATVGGVRGGGFPNTLVAPCEW
jgi:hypothetical protein